MRILVYGAGCIGSLYAGLLTASEQEVAILARGERLARIHSHGIELVDANSAEKSTLESPRLSTSTRPTPSTSFWWCSPSTVSARCCLLWRAIVRPRTFC